MDGKAKGLLTTMGGKAKGLRTAGGVLLLSALLGACGGSRGETDDFPADFAKRSDVEKVAFVMEKVGPDSVARFICDAASGRLDGVRIDSLNQATLYAYDHYKEQDLQTFHVTYEDYSAALPLDYKMRLYKKGGECDPDAMGYQLGLEYISSISDGSKTPAQVDDELQAFRRACDESPEDSLTYKRFMTGLKVALEAEGEARVPHEIYKKYTQQ
ncbi:MAG: hypothetical protein HDR80_00710 [Bacteroides sp.]|nr:hypothetical protein [Bacteroides sp.]